METYINHFILWNEILLERWAKIVIIKLNPSKLDFTLPGGQGAGWDLPSWERGGGRHGQGPAAMGADQGPLRQVKQNAFINFVSLRKIHFLRITLVFSWKK